jgi:DNA-binding beta-propeller fold protein YncE
MAAHRMSSRWISGRRWITAELVSGTVPSELGFSGLGYPAAVTVDSAGGVYVTDTVSNQVLKLPAAK